MSEKISGTALRDHVEPSAEPAKSEPGLANLHVDCVNEERNYGSVGWEAEGARFHIWVTLPGLAHNGILHKNVGSGRAHSHRSLNARSKKWAPVIDAAFNEVRTRDLIAGAIAAKDAEDAEWRRLTEESAAFERKREAGPDLYAAAQSLINGIDTGLVRLETDADETLANTMRDLRSALSHARGED